MTRAWPWEEGTLLRGSFARRGAVRLTVVPFLDGELGRERWRWHAERQGVCETEAEGRELAEDASANQAALDRTAADHVVFLPTIPLPAPVGDFRGLMPMRCEHCGTRVAVALPMAVNDLSALGRGFFAQHRDCVAEGKEGEP